MINGIDLLFVVIGLVMLFLVWHYGSKYNKWSEWDNNRRHARKLARFDRQFKMEEEKYRKQLRLLLPIFLLTVNFTKFGEAIKKASKSIDEFGRKLAILPSDVKE
jgi:hypothetical protein